MKISYPENFDINRMNTLVFDWGGVITNISAMESVRALTGLGHRHLDDYFGPAAANDLFLRLELGKVTPEEVYDELNSSLDIKATRGAIRTAICAMMLDTPLVRLTLLQKLRKTFQLILLSNTNSIHTTFYNNKLKDQHGINFPSLFHKVYYSHELGLRKPGKEIFEKMIADARLEPEKTLFLDDTKTNIETARSLSINCILINEEYPMEKIFSAWI